MMPPDEHIPSKWAIIPYYLIAGLAFVITTFLCILAAPAFTGHYFQPKLLSITHLAILGWAVTIIFGATNQLAPVIAEQKLFSEKLPVIVLVLLVTGVCILIPSFWFFSFTALSYIGGCMLLIAFVIHTYNVLKTTIQRKDNIISDFIAVAHLWLLLTAAIGLMLLFNLRFPFLPDEHLHYLKIHASIGMAGWFLQLVIGVSSRLIPMFLLSRTEEQKWLNITYYIINITLVLFLMEGMVFRTNMGHIFYLLLIIIGLACYFIYIRKCYVSAMRKQMDNGMKQTFLALGLIAIPFGLLLWQILMKDAVPPHIVSAYGFAFFAGFISTIIMGQTFKTLPFIVWMHITRRDKLPEILPKDLYHEKWVKWQMVIFLLGYLAMLMGILMKLTIVIYFGAIFMTMAALIYCSHTLFISLKLVRNDH